MPQKYSYFKLVSEKNLLFNSNALLSVSFRSERCSGMISFHVYQEHLSTFSSHTHLLCRLQEAEPTRSQCQVLPAAQLRTAALASVPEHLGKIKTAQITNAMHLLIDSTKFVKNTLSLKCYLPFSFSLNVAYSVEHEH